MNNELFDRNIREKIKNIETTEIAGFNKTDTWKAVNKMVRNKSKMFVVPLIAAAVTLLILSSISILKIYHKNSVIRDLQKQVSALKRNESYNLSLITKKNKQIEQLTTISKTFQTKIRTEIKYIPIEKEVVKYIEKIDTIKIYSPNYIKLTQQRKLDQNILENHATQDKNTVSYDNSNMVYFPERSGEKINELPERNFKVTLGRNYERKNTMTSTKGIKVKTIFN